MTKTTYHLTDGSTIAFNHRVVIGSAERSYVLVHYRSDGNSVDVQQPLTGAEDPTQVVQEYCSRTGYTLVPEA
jgi:hypothetical protein